MAQILSFPSKRAASNRAHSFQFEQSAHSAPSPASRVLSASCMVSEVRSVADSFVTGRGVVRARSGSKSPLRVVQSPTARERRIMDELARCGDTITLDRILLAEEVITLDNVVQESDLPEGKPLEATPLSNRRALAQRHLEEAGRLVGEEGEEGRLLGWVLEDCAELLRREWGESQGSLDAGSCNY
jgi:hypothetical protein